MEMYKQKRGESESMHENGEHKSKSQYFIVIMWTEYYIKDESSSPQSYSAMWKQAIFCVVVCNAYTHKSGESLNQIISQGSRKSRRKETHLSTSLIQFFAFYIFSLQAADFYSLRYLLVKSCQQAIHLKDVRWVVICSASL